MEEKDINHLIKDKLREHTHPLTKEDFVKVREVLDHHSRVRWLWSSIKVWLVAAMAFISFLTIGLDGLKKILRGLIS